MRSKNTPKVTSPVYKLTLEDKMQIAVIQRKEAERKAEYKLCKVNAKQEYDTHLILCEKSFRIDMADLKLQKLQIQAGKGGYSLIDPQTQHNQNNDSQEIQTTCGNVDIDAVNRILQGRAVEDNGIEEILYEEQIKPCNTKTQKQQGDNECKKVPEFIVPEHTTSSMEIPNDLPKNGKNSTTGSDQVCLGGTVMSSVVQGIEEQTAASCPDKKNEISPRQEKTQDKLNGKRQLKDSKHCSKKNTDTNSEVTNTTKMLSECSPEKKKETKNDKKNTRRKRDPLQMEQIYPSRYADAKVGEMQSINEILLGFRAKALGIDLTDNNSPWELPQLKEFYQLQWNDIGPAVRTYGRRIVVNVLDNPGMEWIGNPKYGDHPMRIKNVREKLAEAARVSTRGNNTDEEPVGQDTNGKSDMEINKKQSRFTREEQWQLLKNELHVPFCPGDIDSDIMTEFLTNTKDKYGHIIILELKQCGLGARDTKNKDEIARRRKVESLFRQMEAEGLNPMFNSSNGEQQIWCVDYYNDPYVLAYDMNVLLEDSGLEKACILISKHSVDEINGYVKDTSIYDPSQNFQMTCDPATLNNKEDFTKSLQEQNDAYGLALFA